MIACAHANQKRFGRDRKGNQRFRCLFCGKTWTERKPRPIGDMRIDHADAVKVLEMLLEGVSIRSTVRITGIAKGTILRLLRLIGNRAQYYWATTMRGLPASNAQADEVWGFVAMKERTKTLLHRGGDCGDAYTFLAIERDTKLVPTWHVGRTAGCRHVCRETTDSDRRPLPVDHRWIQAVLHSDPVRV